MHRLSLSLLTLLTALLPLPVAAKTPRPVEDLLLVAPLDTAEVTVDSGLDASVLASSQVRRKHPSDAALVARGFYPAFGQAMALAARKVEVLDSSAALGAAWTGESARAVVLPAARPGDSARFRVPSVPPDSARYVLVLGRLAFSESARTVARAYKAPTPPFYDPATGKMNPGNRKGYAEGPGRVYTLTVTARWLIWDNRTQAPLARGEAMGESSYRGEAGKDPWDEAARELAKALLRQTAFSPF